MSKALRMRRGMATGGCAMAFLLFPAAAAAFHDGGDQLELNVGIAQTQSSASIDAGETVTYTVTATNHEQGRSRSIGFDLHVSKPGRYASKVDARYTGFSSSAGRCELTSGSHIPNQYAQCEAAHVPPAGQATFTASVRANESITHWVDLTGAQIGTFPPCCFRDNSPADNDARLDTSVVSKQPAALIAVSGAATQDVDKLGLRVFASQRLWLRVRGSVKIRGGKRYGLKRVRRLLPAGKTREIRLRLSRRRRAAVKRALARGRVAQASVKLATRAGGRDQTVRRTITLTP